jgi:hypothetical protein
MPLERVDAGRHAEALQIEWRCAGQAVQHRGPAGHQPAVRQHAEAQYAIDTLLHRIHPAVAFAHRQLDLGIARKEVGKAWHEEVSRQRALHVDPQQASGFGAAEGAFGLLDVVEDGEAAAIVGLAVQRRPHRPRGPLEQAHTQPLLHLLDRFGDRRPRDPAVMGRQGEAAAFDDAREQPHRIQPIHGIRIIRKSRIVLPNVA